MPAWLEQLGWEDGGRSKDSLCTLNHPFLPPYPPEVPLGYPCKALHSSLLGGKELNKLVPTKVSVADSPVPVL